LRGKGMRFALGGGKCKRERKERGERVEGRAQRAGKGGLEGGQWAGADERHVQDYHKFVAAVH